MFRTLSLAAIYFSVGLPGVTLAGDCTAAFCQPQAAAATVVVPQQALTVQSVAAPAVAVQTVATPVVVQRARPVVIRQRAVAVRRTPVRNFLFGQRSVVRVRSSCR